MSALRKFVLLAFVILVFSVQESLCSPLSENVTRVLNDLLKKPYDKRLRPLLGENALFVRVSFRLDSFLGIDETSSGATVRMTFRQTWLEPRLTFPAGVVPNDTIQLGPEQTKYLWIPDTVISNQRNLDKVEGHESTFLNFDGSISLSVKFMLTFDCELNYSYYPFDTQTCSIIFKSNAYDSRDIIYAWMNEELVIGSGSNGPLLTGRFKFISFDAQTATTKHKNGNSVSLILKLHFEGMWNKLYFSVFLPFTIFTLISLATLWVNFETAKIPILVNLVNLGAFSIYLAVLENVNMYGTAAGQYLNISLSFISLSLLAQFLRLFFESAAIKGQAAPKIEHDEDEDGGVSSDGEDVEKGMELGDAKTPWGKPPPRRRSAASQSSPPLPEYKIYAQKVKVIVQRFVCQSHWILLGGFIISLGFYFGIYINSQQSRVQEYFHI